MRRILLLTTVWVALVAPGARAETIFDPGGWQVPPQREDEVLDAVSAFGADTVRIRVLWGGDWTFDQLDHVIQGAHARGLDVLLTPTGYWGSLGPGKGSPADFGAFVGSLADRYPGVHQWAIWNEPDFQMSGSTYREVFLAAQAALRARGHPSSEMLIGETSPLIGLGGRDQPFVRDVLCLNKHWHLRTGCRPVSAGGWAVHPYSRESSYPWKPALLGMGMSDLPILHRALRKAAAAGAVRHRRVLPVYITEYGVLDYQPHQARMLRGAACMARRIPWVRSFAQYLLYDDGNFNSGLRTQTGEPKVTEAAFAARGRRCPWLRWSLARDRSALQLQGAH